MVYMTTTYTISFVFSIPDKEFVYHAGTLHPVIYTGEAHIGYFLSGHVHNIEDMHIYIVDSISSTLNKKTEGSRYYHPITHTLDSCINSNNINIDFQYNKNDRALMKGIILLDAPSPHIITIDVYEINEFGDETLLGSTFSETDGKYYINFPIKDYFNYKVVASYLNPT